MSNHILTSQSEKRASAFIYTGGRCDFGHCAKPATHATVTRWSSDGGATELRLLCAEHADGWQNGIESVSISICDPKEVTE